MAKPPKKKQPRAKPRPKKSRSFLTRVREWLESSEAGNWRSAGGLVVNQKGAIAIIRQGKRWTFPKGRLDPGETLNQAARREVFEEAGLSARITAYLGVREGERHDTHYFLMKLQQDVGVRDDEADEVRFVKPAKARELLHSRGDLLILRRAVACLAGRAIKIPDPAP